MSVYSIPVWYTTGTYMAHSSMPVYTIPVWHTAGCQFTLYLYGTQQGASLHYNGMTHSRMPVYTIPVCRMAHSRMPVYTITVWHTSMPVDTEALIW